MKSLLLITFVFALRVFAEPVSVGEAGEIKDNLHVPVVLSGVPVESGHVLQKYSVFLNRYSPSGEYKGSCTGVIVARDMVLTSAHCLGREVGKVIMHFGVGGAAGWTHKITSDRFKHHATYQFRARTGSYWDANGKLIYDPQYYQEFQQSASTRTEWALYPFTDEYKNMAYDIGVIAVPGGIPAGYIPVELYRGQFNFKESVWVAGYGLNSRKREENNVTQLRALAEQLIGYVRDSGGGTFYYDQIARKYFLLGINAMVYNNCSNSHFIMLPHRHTDWINSNSEALRRTLSL
mgnify:FL=1